MNGKNAPERDEMFDDNPKNQNARWLKDPAVNNAGTMTISKEDHTVGNLLRSKLTKDSKVLFAGYKIPHPLQYEVQVLIQTCPPQTPFSALMTATNSVLTEFDDLEKVLDAEFRKFGTH